MWLSGRFVTIRRIAVGSRTAFEGMNRAIAQHGSRPVTDRVFPFSEAKDAYRHLEACQHVGKVVVAGASGVRGRSALRLDELVVAEDAAMLVDKEDFEAQSRDLAAGCGDHLPIELHSVPKRLGVLR